MPTVHVRYMVNDVEAAIAFYTTHLGFTLISKTLPAFADVARGDLRLLLSGPASSAGREDSQHQRPPRPRAPSPRPRSQAITPPAPHPAAPLEPQAQLRGMLPLPQASSKGITLNASSRTWSGPRRRERPRLHQALGSPSYPAR